MFLRHCCQYTMLDALKECLFSRYCCVFTKDVRGFCVAKVVQCDIVAELMYTCVLVLHDIEILHIDYCGLHSNDISIYWVPRVR